MKLLPLTSLRYLVAFAFLIPAATETAQAQPQQMFTQEWQRILSHMSFEKVDDGTGNKVPTIRIHGANLQIVNGLGSTQTQNGAGNLIVGYNEFGNTMGDNRTGSHNIAFGEANSFTSFGGLVGPKNSTISGAFASVSGGTAHVASGNYSSITGGERNLATNTHAAVSGGRSNVASGITASVSGGFLNTASGRFSSVSGGDNNTASGISSSVSGGYRNSAIGSYSSVSGGAQRSVTGPDDWAAGSLFETN